MGNFNTNGNRKTLWIREQIIFVLGILALVYEAAYEHSSHAIVYGIGLIMLGIIPFSVLDRFLAAKDWTSSQSHDTKHNRDYHG